MANLKDIVTTLAILSGGSLPPMRPRERRWMDTPSQLRVHAIALAITTPWHGVAWVEMMEHTVREAARDRCPHNPVEQKRFRSAMLDYIEGLDVDVFGPWVELAVSNGIGISGVGDVLGALLRHVPLNVEPEPDLSEFQPVAELFQPVPVNPKPKRPRAEKASHRLSSLGRKRG